MEVVPPDIPGFWPNVHQTLAKLCDSAAEPWFWTKNLRIDIHETISYKAWPLEPRAKWKPTQPTIEDIVLALQPFRNIWRAIRDCEVRIPEWAQGEECIEKLVEEIKEARKMRAITDDSMQRHNVARISYSKDSGDEYLQTEGPQELEVRREARGKRIKREEDGLLWEKIAWDESDDWYEIDPGSTAEYLRWRGEGELDDNTSLARERFVDGWTPAKAFRWRRYV